MAPFYLFFIIVGRFPNETMGFGPKTFIVKSLIISNMDNHPIYIKTERRGKELLAAREAERERESVCVRDGELLKMEVASVVKMSVGEMDHFGII